MIYPNEIRTRTGEQYFTIFGKKFPTMEEATAYRDETFQKRTQLAGFPLTERELADGIRRGRPPATTAEKVDFANWKPVKTPLPPKPKPASYEETMLDEHGEKLGFSERQRRTAEADRQYREKLREWEAAANREDPRREAARAHSLTVWEKIAFDMNAPESLLLKAEKLRQQAEHDIDAYQALSAEIAAETQALHSARVDAATTEIGQMSSRLNALEPLPPFTGETTNNEPV